MAITITGISNVEPLHVTPPAPKRPLPPQAPQTPPNLKLVSEAPEVPATPATPEPPIITPEPAPAPATIASNTPAPPKIIPPAPEHFVKNLRTLCSDLVQYSITVHCPTWSVAPPTGTELMALQAGEGDPNAVDETGREVQVKKVKGKHSSGTLQYDVHPIMAKLAANKLEVGKLMSRYTLQDADDRFRLVSVFCKEEFEGAMYLLEEERRLLALQLDAAFESGELQEVIRREHPDYADWIISRMPRPPYFDRLGITVRRRAMPSFEADFDMMKISEAGRNVVSTRIREQATKYAEEQAKALVAGLVDPIADLADRINGKKLNLNFDESLPEGPKNRKYMAGIENGKKTDNLIELLSSSVDRLVNFKHLLPTNVFDQIRAAQESIARCGGDSRTLRDNSLIQNAIKKSFSDLADSLHESTGGRERRHMMT
jgi:hypothetical protein